MPDFARFSRKIPDFATGMAKSRKCRHFPNPVFPVEIVADVVFQHDSAPEQIAKVTKQYMADNSILKDHV